MTKNNTLEGRIVAVKAERGFGFIEVQGYQSDIFFHAKNLTRSLKFDEQLEGRKVQFELSIADRPEALNVRSPCE